MMPICRVKLITPLTILLGVLSGAHCGELQESYLHWPTSREVQSNEATFGPIKQALAPLGQPHLGTRSLDSWIIDTVKELRAKEKDPNKLLVYEMLSQLGEERGCSPKMGNIWLKVLALVEVSDQVPLRQNLYDFLWLEGRRALADCAWEVSNDFYDRLEDDENFRSRVEQFEMKVVNKFLSSVSEGLTNDPDDVQLFEAAKQFRLAEFKQPERLSELVAGARSATIGDYLARGCRELLAVVGDIFEQINVGKLGYFWVSGAKLKKLNEFYRIACVEADA